MHPVIDGIGLKSLVEVFAAIGPFGIIIVLWWLDMKNMRTLVDRHQQDMTSILQQHREYMDRIQRNYDNNIVLVKSYEEITKHHKDLIVMVTEAMTRLGDAIHQNQFCPMQRVEKRIEIHGVDQ